MERYFTGSQLVKDFRFELDQKNQVSGQIHALWMDTGMGQTSHCGVESDLTIEDTYGITEVEAERVEEEIGFQFGISSIAQVKNNIKVNSDYTVTFNKQLKTTRKFAVASDKCGSTCIKLFKKLLIIDLTYYRTGFFGRVYETKSQFKEETQHVDCHVTRSEINDNCGCDKTSIKPIDGNVRLSWGFVSVLTPFFNTKNGFVTELGGLEFDVSPMNLRRSAHVSIESKVIPDMYRFLSRDTSDVYRISLELDSLTSFGEERPISAIRVENPEALIINQNTPGKSAS